MKVTLRYVGRENISLSIERNAKDYDEARRYCEFIRDFNFRLPGLEATFLLAGAVANIDPEDGRVLGIDMDLKTVADVQREVEENQENEVASLFDQIGLTPPTHNSKDLMTSRAFAAHGLLKEEQPDNVIYADFSKNRKVKDDPDDDNNGRTA